MPNAKDENDLAALHERLQAARRVLREAYDQRDALAEEIATAEKIGAGVDPKLLIAFSAHSARKRTEMTDTTAPDEPQASTRLCDEIKRLSLPQIDAMG